MKKVILILVCAFCMAMGLFAGGHQKTTDNQGQESTNLTAECGCPLVFMTSGPNLGTYVVKHGPNCLLNKPETPQEDPTPTITLSPSSFSNTWYTTELTITVTVKNISSSSGTTVTDSANKTATLQFDKNASGNYIYTYTINTPGTHNITFTARNSSKSDSKQVTIKLDNKKPTIEIKPSAPTNWINYDYNLQYVITEDHSGIKSFSINGQSTGSTVKNQTYRVSGEGIHTVKAIATDKAGNSKELSTTVKIDKTLPRITPAVYFGKDEGGRLSTLTIKADVTDTLSGLSSVSLQDNQKTAQPFLVTEGSKSKQIGNIYDIDGLKRGAENLFTITATDQAGNLQTAIIPVYIPEEMSLSVDNSTQTLQLWNINPDVEQVSLTRVLNVSGIDIESEENFLKVFNPDSIYIWDNPEMPPETMLSIWNRIHSITGITSYTVDNNLGPFGHKKVVYTVTREIMNPIPGGPTCEEVYQYTDSTPPNHEAQMSLRIQGSESYVDLDPMQPVTADIISDLKLDSDGAVRLLFKMEDEDAEPYHVKLLTIPYAEKDSFSIGIPVEGFEADFISEKCQSSINGKTFIHPDEDGWYEFEDRLFLPFNHSQVYLLEWDEGFEQHNYAPYETEMIPLKAEPSDLGGFILGVDENALYNANGITATVHHEFELSINEQDQSDITDISWDFGADSTSVRTEKLLSSNGYSVVYGQKEDREGNTSEYTLTLSVLYENGLEKTIPLPVFIEDTRYGKLLGDETWRGQHLLLGDVVVPDGITLELEKNLIDSGNTTEILCYGSSRQNEKGKLTIEKGGTVVISTDLCLQEAKNTQSQGFVAVEESDEKLMWAGIEVSGSLTSEESSLVSIIGAQRGLILRGGGIINLANITIKDCLCGLHIIGGNTGAKLTLTEGTITQNSEYGVKIETDSSGSNNNDLTFNKVVITNNGRDSYMNGKFNVINGGE